MVAVEAKAKVKARHQNAIDHYKKWREENPKAMRKRRYEMFDFFVDHIDATTKVNDT